MCTRTRCKHYKKQKELQGLKKTTNVNAELPKATTTRFSRFIEHDVAFSNINSNDATSEFFTCYNFRNMSTTLQMLMQLVSKFHPKCGLIKNQ
jgi:hypothetical protein